MTMLTECCKVEPCTAREIWGSKDNERFRDYWYCPKCNKGNPPCKIVPETAKEISDRKCEEYGSNSPERGHEQTSREAYARAAMSREAERSGWNAALEALSDVIVYRAENNEYFITRADLQRLIEETMK